MGRILENSKSMFLKNGAPVVLRPTHTVLIEGYRRAKNRFGLYVGGWQ